MDCSKKGDSVLEEAFFELEFIFSDRAVFLQALDLFCQLFRIFTENAEKVRMAGGSSGNIGGADYNVGFNCCIQITNQLYYILKTGGNTFPDGVPLEPIAWKSSIGVAESVWRKCSNEHLNVNFLLSHLFLLVDGQASRQCACSYYTR